MLRMRRDAAPNSLTLTWRYAGAALFAASVFAIDSFTALGSAVAVLYVLVLLVVGEKSTPQGLYAVAGACIALTLFSYVYGHGLTGEIDVLLRLVFSIAAILATTFILLERLDDRKTVAAQAELLEVTSDAIFLTDASGLITYWNSGAERLYGWPSEEVLGRDPHQLLRSQLPLPRAAINDSLRDHGSWEGEIAQSTRNGRTVYVFSRWRQRSTTNPKLNTILESNTDVTDRKAAIEALAKSEERFRTIFETLAVAIWEHDLRPVKDALDALRASGITDMPSYLASHPDFVRSLRRTVRVTDVNTTGLKLMGIATKQEFFTHLDDFLADADDSFAAFLVALDAGVSSYENEAIIRTRRGEILRVIVAFNFPPRDMLDRVQACILNITERVKAQEALQQARNQLDHALRAATVGEVSASIAHEINQPLAAITTHAAAARRWMDRDPPNLGEVRASLQEASAAAMRASEVVRRIRLFMTRVEPDRMSLPVNALVEEAIHLIQNELGANSVKLTTALEAEGAAILGDRVLLQQVVINLMNNAIQAMQILAPDKRALSVRTVLSGESVLIAVADSGPGFSEEAAQKAFEPFYTTKAGGMGLGLAMCRTILAAHDGDIRVATSPGHMGGDVTIRLPCAIAAFAGTREPSRTL
ncbi:Histidine kinase [Hyphomicrobiales bacterium]|nr:Histidine kinase [Hyphomicrobiales bacterium]CAH1684042.1 Histidine kinase [Hyphomicrobiales bacterium]